MLAGYALIAAVPATAAFFALTYIDRATDLIALAVAGAAIVILTALPVFRCVAGPEPA